MKNYVKPGQSMKVVAGAAVVSGRPYQVGTIIAVAAGDAAIGEEYEGSTVGVYKFANPDSVAFAQGALVGWDDAAFKCVAAGTGTYDIGTAHQAASGALDVEVLLPLGPR